MAPSPCVTMTNSPHHAGALALLATLALTASAVAPAQAAGPPRSAKPSFALSAAGGGGALLLRGTRGRVLHGAVLVHNVSRHRITVRLQPADIGNATNGNANYITAGRKLAGRWLRLSATTVHLAPKSSRRIVFALRVPRNVPGASHYAGIVAIDTAETVTAKAPRRSAKGAGFSFSRINRQALPITIRLPGPLTRRLTLRSVKLDVQPLGAGLMLGLLPKGTVLMQDAKVNLRVSRGKRTILRNVSTLGQLFPDSRLDYRIAWSGRPTEGDYLVRGVIRPKSAAPVYINQTIKFTPAKVKELKRETPPVAAPEAAPAPGLPSWVWLALAGAGALLVALAFAFWRFARRARRSAAATAEPPAALQVAPVRDADHEDRHDRTAA
jgi:hypothetical protein